MGGLAKLGVSLTGGEGFYPMVIPRVCVVCHWADYVGFDSGYVLDVDFSVGDMEGLKSDVGPKGGGSVGYSWVRCVVSVNSSENEVNIKGDE